jgi:outer membrane receptor protein involved in Fe transport
MHKQHVSRPRAAALSILACFAIASSVSWAQQAGLQVAVTDAAAGRPVGRQTVTATNAALGLTLTRVTDDFGQARFDNLATGGAWVVSVAADGKEATVSDALELRSNFVRSINLVINRGDLAEVVVSARKPVTGINTVNAEVAATLDRQALTALPIEGRDVQQALIRLPNVVPSTGFFPEAPAVSINGANGLYVNYTLDGLDNNENFLGGPKFPAPLGAVRDVTVLANNYSAEFGRTANGVVNYTSRSGTNDWQVEAFALVRPGQPLDADSPFTGRDLSGNAVGESFERRQFGGSVGGPLALDRTFVHVNVESIRDRNVQSLVSPSLGIAESVTGNNEFLLSSARIDHQLAERWQLTGRLNHGRVTIERPGGALGGGNVQFPSAGSDQNRISTLAAVTAVYAGERFAYEGSVQWSRFDWNYGEARTKGPQVVALDQSGIPVAIVGHPGFIFDDTEKTIQTKHTLRTEIGKHRLRFGIDVLTSDFELVGGGNADGNYTVEFVNAMNPSRPGVSIAQLQARAQAVGTALSANDILALNPTVIGYGVELRPNAFGERQTQSALFFEDEWSLRPDLTLTLGLRYDYDSLTELGSGSGDTNNIAPRLAINWRPNERSVVRAGAGIFYDKLLYAVISDALQRNTTAPNFRGQLQQLIAAGRLPADTDIDRITFDGNLTANPSCVGNVAAGCPSASAIQQQRGQIVSNEIRILNPEGYDNPRSLQLSGGYQYQLADAWSGSIDLIYNRSRDLVRLRDLNAPSAFTPNAAALTTANIAALRAGTITAESLGLVRSQAAADATRLVAPVPGGARQITVSETRGNAEYRALTLQVNKERAADRYGLRFAYTLSKLTNDTDDINFRASNANDFAADEGPSANDRRHVISAVGIFYPLEGLSVSVAGLFQSGQPVNLVPDASVFGTQDLNGDGRSFGENFVGNSDRYPGESRNSARLPWSKTIDLGVRYDWRVFDQTVEVSADVFNVFDWNNQSGFANAATTSNQVQFGGGVPFTQRNAGPPRQFQFGIAWKR